MEKLIEIPRNNWENLRDLYKEVWPEGVVAYCILDIHIANPALGDILDFKVYSPEGDITKGMVATTNSFGFHHLLIHPIKDIEKIYEALKTTKVIDWSTEFCVPSATVQVIECLKRLQESCGIKITYETKALKHLLEKDTPLFDLSVCPPDSYVGPLKPAHVPLINKTWTYQDENTHKLFETLMNQNMTYVLYSSKDDEPMTWITVDTEGALSHLYTVEAYRRRGYGEFITKYAANDIRRKGRHVLAYTVEGNDEPENLFKKLEFRVVGKDQWIFLEKA